MRTELTRVGAARDAGALRWLALILFVLASAGGPTAQSSPSPKTLQIYIVDVEGGNATLFVGPTGESLLVDTGNGGPQGPGPANAVRDAGRIMAAVSDAGLTQIDHLITTHWHSDHFGGMVELASRIPIRHFIDHGPNAADDFARSAADEFVPKAYAQLHGGAKRTVAKPGDRVPVAGLDILVVASGGNVITNALTGAGRANAYCSAFRPGQNNAEDPLSVGILVAFGAFRAVHLGDLTKNKEFELMCPTNRIGMVDVLLGLHHGVDSSNSEVLVHALRPRVAIMNNGIRKGGPPEVMRIVHSSPGLEDLWQTHFSELSGQEYTVPGMFIANQADEPLSALPVAPSPVPQPGAVVQAAPAHNGRAYWIKVSAQTDGTFAVANQRNGFTKSYSSSREK